MSGILDSFRQAISPPSDLPPAEWGRCVPIMNSERGKNFDPDQTRWLIKPMNHYADYVTRHMTCAFPTGAGKSTFFEVIGCWIVKQSPGSYLYSSISDDNAERWQETRYKFALKNCEETAALWPHLDRNLMRKGFYNWGFMFQLFTGANLSSFQEVSITYGCGDEAAFWKHGMIREWLGRHHSRENRKFVLVSQASFADANRATSQTEDGESEDSGNGETHEFHIEHDKGRLWEFGWKCQECGDNHPFRFEQMKWETIPGDDQASADTCRRVCPSCHHEYPDDISTRRMLHDSLKEHDGFILTKEKGLRGYESFQGDAGMIWWIPWSDDVLQKIEADRQMARGDHTKLMQWEQKRRARPWDMSKSVTTTDIKTSDYNSMDYTNGSMIDGEQIRFATVDVGADHYWLRIRSWAAGGDSRGLKASYIGTDDELIRTIEKYGIQPQCVFVDVGFDQERIASLCVKHGWRGVKGDGNRKAGWEWPITSGPRKGQRETRLYGPKFLAKSKEGFRCEVWPVATTPLQYILQRLIEGKGAKWEVESDVPPTFPKHLNSERLVAKRNAQGHDVPTWTRFGANHFRDTEVYQLAAALMAGAFRPSKEDVEAATPAED